MGYPETNTQKEFDSAPLWVSAISHSLPSWVQWPLKNQEAPALTKSDSTHPNHHICIQSHWLQTIRAGEVITSEVHCLTGINARTKPGKVLPHHLTQGRAWTLPRGRGETCKQNSHNHTGNCRRYAPCLADILPLTCLHSKAFDRNAISNSTHPTQQLRIFRHKLRFPKPFQSKINKSWINP